MAEEARGSRSEGQTEGQKQSNDTLTHKEDRDNYAAEEDASAVDVNR